MTLQTLFQRGFRNLSPLEVGLPSGMVAVVGPNGAGKTSLLESVAVLGNLTSFRPGVPAEWIQRGAQGFELAGDLVRGTTVVRLVQRLAERPGAVRQLFRGSRKLGSGEYLTLCPVAAFSSHDRVLIAGGPQDRRRFLDRLAFHLHPETLLISQRYRRALAQRNALLRGNGADSELEAFESDLAFLGGRLMLLRRRVVAGLQPLLTAELAALSPSLSRPYVRYNAGDEAGEGDATAVTARLRGLLERARRRDRKAGLTRVGPHRHDLEVTVQGLPARTTLSAGQVKVLATALKFAALDMIAHARGEVPTVVFDDVDAELDGGVLVRVLKRLASCPQALISTAHEEVVVPRLADAALWRMETGAIQANGGERSRL